MSCLVCMKQCGTKASCQVCAHVSHLCSFCQLYDALYKLINQNTTKHFLIFWRFGFYQRPSSEEVCLLPLPVLATIVMTHCCCSLMWKAATSCTLRSRRVTWRRFFSCCPSASTSTRDFTTRHRWRLFTWLLSVATKWLSATWYAHLRIYFLSTFMREFDNILV